MVCVVKVIFFFLDLGERSFDGYYFLLIMVRVDWFLVKEEGDVRLGNYLLWWLGVRDIGCVGEKIWGIFLVLGCEFLVWIKF